MPIKDRKELFVWMLSNAMQGTEKAEMVYQEIGKLATDPVIKETLEARAFLSNKIVSTLKEGGMLSLVEIAA